MRRSDRWQLPAAWPDPSIASLLRACLHPDDGEARAAWRAWIGTHDFDAVTQRETRLLANLSTRIAALDPESPFRPRMEGLARQNWTRTQLVIAGAAGALDVMNEAGIPFVLFKGAAQYAEGLATQTRRVMGDIDMLVPAAEMERAIRALTAAGWESEKGESAAYLAAVAPARIGINLRKGAIGEVDVHRAPFHISGNDPILNARLWATATPATLQGRPVRVASPEINVIVSLSHAFGSRGGDWAIDVATRLARQPVDWNAVADLAARWHQVLPVRIALNWLRDVAGQPVPANALAKLDALPVSALDRAVFWATVRTRDRHHPLVRQLARQAVTPFLRRRGDVMSASDRTRAQIVGARPVAGTATASGAWTTETTVVAPAEGGRIALTLEVERPLKRRRVHFDVVDGEVLVAHIRTPLQEGAEPARVRAVFSGVRAGRALVVLSRPTRALTGDDIAAASRPVRFRIVEILPLSP